MKNRVVHFEIPSDNPEASMTFFKTVFGWQFQQMGAEKYWFAITGDVAEQGINGAIMQKRDPRQPLVNSIMVENLEATLAQITASGGQVVVPKTVIPHFGYSAYFLDPDGNIHGVWQEDATAA